MLAKLNRLTRWLLILLLLSVVAGLSGCRTISFYAQAVRGQYQIFAHEQPIERLIAEPKTPERLRQRLELVQRLRAFAGNDLKLPVDGHYRKYVDLHRPFVVWNVEAAPELSLQPKTWWYPLVGSLEYRGYFSKRGATNYAAYLKRKSYDVSVGGVEAYSTLGWFKDPLLNTFIFEPDADLAEIIFHELGHQRVFARGDTDFNEAFATTVGQEGARRWLKTKGDTTALDKYLAHLRRNDQFVRLVKRTRLRLEKLYGDERTPTGKIKTAKIKPAIPADQLRAQKQQIFEEMRQEYHRLRDEGGGDPEYDGWFERPINNARLNAVAAYYDLVPAFEHLLALNSGDLGRFYEAASRLAREPKKKRDQWLNNLGSDGSHGVAIAAAQTPN